MERDVHFRPSPGKPNWVIDIKHEGLRIAGVGNPLVDKEYCRILNGKLRLGELIELEDIFTRQEYKVAKPIMMILEPDRVFVLKPSYAARQETTGMILQHLVDRAEAGLIGNYSESE
ncbi:MAG: hypothetical protein ACLQQ4_18070 [Bacteroidia bacterium]